jgi:hypothetical protein
MPPYPIFERVAGREAGAALVTRVWLSCRLPLMVQVAEPPASSSLIDR